MDGNQKALGRAHCAPRDGIRISARVDEPLRERTQEREYGVLGRLYHGLLFFTYGRKPGEHDAREHGPHASDSSNYLLASIANASPSVNGKGSRKAPDPCGNGNPTARPHNLLYWK